MIPFELAEPTSLGAAVKLLDPDDETVRPIAGGTALMLMMKAGVFRPQKLISLRKIESKYSGIAAATGDHGGGSGGRHCAAAFFRCRLSFRRLQRFDPVRDRRRA